MTTIKLNNYYPHLTECVTLEVSEEIAVTLSIGGRMCDSYKRRKRDHDECSLDGTPGFEADVTYPPLTPEEIMELAEDRAALYAALDRLPPVQARRVYAHYILGRRQAGRDDSAGDNETCSRPPTDLRGSPAVRASHKRVPNGSMIRWEEPEQRNERIFAARRK
jgi:RNA polymerase sigma-70 factor (ECF subfamily)